MRIKKIHKDNIPQALENKLIKEGIALGAMPGTSVKAKIFQSGLPPGVTARTIYNIIKRGSVQECMHLKTLIAIGKYLGYNTITFY